MQENTTGQVPEEVYEWLNARLSAYMAAADRQDPAYDFLYEQFIKRWSSMTPKFGEFVGQSTSASALVSLCESVNGFDQALLYDLQIVRALEDGGAVQLGEVFCDAWNREMRETHPQLDAWHARLCRVIHVCPTMAMAIRLHLEGDHLVTFPLPWIGDESQQTQKTLHDLFRASTWCRRIEFLSPKEHPFMGDQPEDINAYRHATSWEQQSAVNWYLHFRGFQPLSAFTTPVGVELLDWERHQDYTCICPALERREAVGPEGAVCQLTRAFVLDSDEGLLELGIPYCDPGISDQEVAAAIPFITGRRWGVYLQHQGVDVIRRLCVIPRV